MKRLSTRTVNVLGVVAAAVVIVAFWMTTEVAKYPLLGGMLLLSYAYGRECYDNGRYDKAQEVKKICDEVIDRLHGDRRESNT